MSNHTEEDFSIPQARALIKDLFQPRPWIYWTDFLISLVIGYGFATLYLTAPLFSWQQGVGLLIGGLALYRVANFMHEVVHFRRGEMQGFKAAWNVLAGIPLLMPSFFYESHMGHHNTNHYGTGLDGEYLPLSNGPWRNIGYFMCQVLLQPIWVVGRFVILTPISFLHPQLRRWTLEYASSFVINFRYRREIPENAPLKLWALMDAACSVRAMGIFIAPVFAAMYPSPLLEAVSWVRIPQLYFMAVMILGLNYIRTLGAHRYRSEGTKMSHVEQLLDSVDITGDPIFTELLCPVGLRFHALHHLFPAIPYHNLRQAHLRLMEGLPAGSAYHRIVYPSFFAVIRELVREIRKASREPSCGADQWYARREEQLRQQHERLARPAREYLPTDHRAPV